MSDFSTSAARVENDASATWPAASLAEPPAKTDNLAKIRRCFSASKFQDWSKTARMLRKESAVYGEDLFPETGKGYRLNGAVMDTIIKRYPADWQRAAGGGRTPGAEQCGLAEAGRGRDQRQFLAQASLER